MASKDAAALLRSAGTRPSGQVLWGSPVPCQRPGVYLVETPQPVDIAPIDERLVAAWIRRIPGLALYGHRPSTTELSQHLSTFWIPGERVVYIGRTRTSVGKRVSGYYRTPLGDPRPHAGGHWLKVLAQLETFTVWWAEDDDPDTLERALLRAFMRRHRGQLPFANRQDGDGVRKAHGITGSTLVRRGTGDGSSRGESSVKMAAKRGRRRASDSQWIAAINRALQELACAQPGGRIRAVEAARGLERRNLLRDSPSRPGKPLRDLLRAGQIEHAHQEGVFWFIECAGSPR